MMYLDEYASPVGLLSLASDGAHLCGLWLEDQKYYQEKLEVRLGVASGDAGEQRVCGPEARERSAGLRQARAWLDAYFAGDDPGALPPVMLHGTPFQEEVWDCLKEISYGKLTTYGDIARKIALRRGRETMSARAVGVAVGRNPVSIIVPCHRVVGAGGNLTGYAGGIARKKKLLAFEGVDLTTLRTPAKGTAL